MKVTYAVRGMMEWNALIPAGRSTLRVRFSGGSATGYGVTPATFSTDNRAVQRVIEESAFFRSGRIFIQAREEDPADVQKSQKVNRTGGVASAASSDPITRMKEMRERREAGPVTPHSAPIYNKEKGSDEKSPEI